MICYKSCRIVDGYPKWVIIDDDGKIVNKSPTKEQLRFAIVGYEIKKRKKLIPKDRKCCVCGGIDTYIDSWGNAQWRICNCNKEICAGYICYYCCRIGGIKTREYLEYKRKNRKCCICGSNETYILENLTPVWYNHVCDKECCTKVICYKYYGVHDPRSNNNCRKLMTKFRRGELCKDTEIGKGIMIECVIAKVRNIEVISVKMDNLRLKLDFTKDIEFGDIQAKSRSPVYGDWNFNDYYDDEFDTIFLVCMEKGWNSIKKLLAIPKYVAKKRHAITIYSNPSRSTWYEMFELDIKLYNDVLQDLLIYLGDKNTFGSKCIKNWLKEGIPLIDG